jgi:membrane protein implicated in regulation of membrane protease activity
MRMLVFVGIYAALAIGLGVGYSWSWAGVVVLLGLLPAGALIWLVRRFQGRYDWWTDMVREQRERNLRG